jgi:hypothetical protein
MHCVPYSRRRKPARTGNEFVNTIGCSSIDKSVGAKFLNQCDLHFRACLGQVEVFWSYPDENVITVSLGKYIPFNGENCASGWTKKFGMIRVDPETGERTPKDSARWYRELLASR